MNQTWLLDRGVKHLLRIAAVSSWVVIATLSLVPGEDRLITGVSGDFEHGLAYLLSSLVARLGIQHTRSRWQFVAYSVAAALFEVCQIWIPGRWPGFVNWEASSAGALSGIVIARTAVHLVEGRARRLRSRKIA